MRTSNHKTKTRLVALALVLVEIFSLMTNVVYGLPDTAATDTSLAEETSAYEETAAPTVDEAAPEASDPAQSEEAPAAAEGPSDPAGPETVTTATHLEEAATATDLEEAEETATATDLEVRTVSADLTAYDGTRYTVHVSYGADAGLPDGAELAVRQVLLAPEGHEAHRAERLGRPYKTERFLEAEEFAACDEALRQALEVQEEDYLPLYVLLDVKLVSGTDLLEPAAPVTVTVETDGAVSGQERAMAAALLWVDEEEDEDGQTVEVTRAAALEKADEAFADETFAGDDADDEKPGDTAAVSFVTDTLGTMGILCVAEKKETWQVRGVTLALYGPKDLQYTAEPVYCEATPGVTVLASFRTPEIGEDGEIAETDGAATMWLSAVAGDSAPWAWSENDGLRGWYTDRDGECHALFGANGTAQPVAITAGDAVEVLWDSGLRQAELTEGAVTVSGLLPPEAELTAKDVTADYGDAAALTGTDSEYTRTVAAYDIDVTADGRTRLSGEADPVEVTVENRAIAPGKAISVWFVDEDGTASRVDCVLSSRKLTFSASRRGVYVVVNSGETTRVATDGRTYEITVTYGPEAAIPAQAALSVRELTGPEYAAYYYRTQVQTGVNSFDTMRAYDIVFVLPDGTEVEPQAPVNVSIRTLDRVIENAQVVHFADGGTEVIDPDVLEDGETLDFTAGSFSVYVVCAWTVEFHWGDYAYHINGNSSILLSELLKKLDVDITLADVTDVSFSNDKYIAVERQVSDWLLRALAPFDTEEALILTLKNGQTVEIRVTDDPEPPAPLTIEAASRKVTFDGNELTMAGTYTCEGGDPTADICSSTDLAEGHHIESVTLTGSQTLPGSSPNVPSGAVIWDGEGNDVTEQYDITYVNGALTVDWPADVITVTASDLRGDIMTYTVTVNPDGYALNEVAGDDKPLIVAASFGVVDAAGNYSESVDYKSVNVICAGDYSYDYSGNTGTFYVPSNETVTITYETRVKGSAGEQVNFTSSATVARSTDSGAEAVSQPVTASGSGVISPTGSDIAGTGGVYGIKLLVYPQGNMQRGLEHATFRLLDSNMRPMKYKSGAKAGQDITFTTDDHGYADVVLHEETDGLRLNKNTVYFLEMTAAPYEYDEGTGDYAYYKKDNTFYSFLISDEASYKYGSVYTYFNGDVLKVRCYPESRGINVTLRFSGNYTLDANDAKNIRFILQKEALDTESGWLDVESHTYAEFSYGSINFEAGSAGGPELEDNATYRVIEENALPATASDLGIEEKVSVSISYQDAGEPQQEDSNEFFVNPDDKLAFSYNLAFTNEYIDHKLTAYKIDEGNGHVLSGAQFTVYTALEDTPVKTYTTGDDGTFIIRAGDELDGGAHYAQNKLYYVTESDPPTDYVMPQKPGKYYFYFSGTSTAVPAGLPANTEAVDLTTSYSSITIPNDSNAVDVPVTVVWGVSGEDPWPGAVKSMVVGLYRTVGDGEEEPVLGEGDVPRTTTMTGEIYYDAHSFTGLPARVNDKPVKYSVKALAIYGEGGTDITKQYASSFGISGTGWYVLYNQGAVSVTVKKEWYHQNGDPVADTSAKPAVVTFDLYRTTTADRASFATHKDLTDYLGGLEPVRKGLQLTNANGWTATVDSLEEKDKSEKTYYYFALENVPANQEDSYTVTAAAGAAPRTLTIKNQQTPPTVTIRVSDVEMTYGDEMPAYAFTAGVDSDQVGSTVTVSGPDGSGNYTATVTEGGDSKDIKFTAALPELTTPHRNVGTYDITLALAGSDQGYRVLFENGTLTVNRAEVTVTAGASKIYGEDDPALATQTSLKYPDDTPIEYEAEREEGSDAGTYRITLSGATEQGNYTVHYVTEDGEGNPYVLTIYRANATVKADDSYKTYGDEDPVLTATPMGLANGDEPYVITYDLTRAVGEDAGQYVITAEGEAVQGNYNVTFQPGTFTINRADVTVTVEDAEKTYGDEDPVWDVTVDGLAGDDDETMISYEIIREPGEDVKTTDGGAYDSYNVVASGTDIQGNYAVTYKNGALTITRAELYVTPDHIVRALNVPDPTLTATVAGWRNGDEAAEAGSLATGTDIVWTYTRSGNTLLTFTLAREAGEDEGEYAVTATGEAVQGNYDVYYEEGALSILSVMKVEVSQPLVDDADANADPSYSYTATLDLADTGLSGYEKEGFHNNAEGHPTLSFSLPADAVSGAKALQVPAGAKLTITQDTQNPDYTTSITLDGSPVASPTSLVIDHVDTYHEVAFTHTRISLPVVAMIAVNQTTEAGATKRDGKGAMGIPRNGSGDPVARSINDSFADEMQAKIGYTLPTDKYYVYDHASLYTTSGAVLVQYIAEIRYHEYSTGAWRWEYRQKDQADFAAVPADSELRLFYAPKHVCKIGEKEYDTIKKAMDAAKNLPAPVTIEMLIENYTVRQSGDAVSVPSGREIILTTATTGYEGSNGTATISRSSLYTSGSLVTNNGTLTLTNITISGNDHINAASAMVTNSSGTLTVCSDTTLKEAKGGSGGAIYVNSGTATISGKLQDNQATRGAGVYVNGGTATLDEDCIATGNSATNGGVVYAYAGTVNITSGGADHFTNNTAQYGGVVCVTGSTVTLSSSGEGSGFNGNSASYGGGAAALQDNAGILNIAGSVSGNTAPRGGAVYVTSGTLNVTGTIGGTTESAANTADHGGAVYMTGGTVNITGTGTVSGNKADAGTAGRGGAIYQSGGTVNVSDGGKVLNNQAVAEGGAIYLAGGTVNLSDSGSQIGGNTAGNGGAVYGAGGTINVSGGAITGNHADGDGGAIRADIATINVTGGSITANTAGGNGGAIYTDTGIVTVSDSGSITANTAGSNGGAVYVSRGTVTYSGGSITGNRAANGSAIFADTGIANISATITGNIASAGGAVGVGSASARLNFSGNAAVSTNTDLNNQERNVCLDVDSELVIFVRGALTSGNKVGVFVPDSVGQELVRKRGDVGGYFGGYSNSGSVESVFKNDRYTELKARIENNRIYWGAALKYDVIYKEAFGPSDTLANQPYDATTGDGFLKVALSKTCYPHGGTDSKYDIYDLVSGLKLYDAYKTDFDARAGNATAGAAAVYAYAFANSKSNKFDGNPAFDKFVTSVEWDYANRRWNFVMQNGDPAPASANRIVILYSKPTYISVTNNNDLGLTLDFSDLTVGGVSVSDLHYGYATAKNGATVATLRPVTPTDLILADGESVKLLFPGAASKSYAFSGTFTEAVATTTDLGTVGYTVNDVAQAEVNPKSQEVTAEGALSTDYSATEIVVGDPLPICRVKWDGGQQECATLGDAVTCMNSVNAGPGATTEFTIEMLVDYLIPKDDVLEIPQGYQVTFTTASVLDGFKGANQGDGTDEDPPRAILSRDFGNTGSSVLLKDLRKDQDTTDSQLNVTNIVFDGRAIAGSGNGGAIRTTCTAVTIQYCDFNGYHATRGGAVFTVRGTITVEDCHFTDCQTNPENSDQKAGGGGLWTTAKHLTVRNCEFRDCTVTNAAANAQAGAIFHNIVRNKSLNFIKDFGKNVNDTYSIDYPVGTTSLIEDCRFYDCHALGGSGGTLETDALEVTIRRCTFVNGYTNKSGGGGGAVNIWTGDLDPGLQNSTDGDVTVESCTFTNCKAQNSGLGGALRTTAAALTLKDCTFEDALASQGGAVAMTNKNAATMNIFGCTFKTCESTGTSGGGGVSTTAKNVTVGDYETRHTLFEDCTANAHGGGMYINRENTAGSTVVLTNATFRNCTASSNNSGGGVYTKAEAATVNGSATLFTDCTAKNLGGGIYQENSGADSSFTFRDGVMEQCTAFGDSGGAIYTSAKTVTMADATVTGSTAKKNGGGLYMNTKTGTPAPSTITNCTMTDLSVTSNDGYGAAVYINGGAVAISDSRLSGTAGKGGAVYQNKDTLTVSNSTVSGRATNGNGGAIYTNSGTLTVSGGTVTGTASNNGGAIYNNGTLNVNGGATIGGAEEDNGIVVYHATAVNGGAVYVANKAKLTLDGGTIAGKTTTGNGGGIYMGSDGATAVTITSGTVAGAAAGSGGGVYQAGGTTTVGATATIGTTIAAGGSTLHTASAANGGGMYVNGGTLNMNGTVTGKATTGSGGGVYLGGGTLNLTGTVAGSTAKVNGGGVYYGGGTFNMTAGDIRDNTAAENGGGVYQATGNTFTLDGGTISGNTATGNGGGVYHAAGTFTMSNGAISGNTAVNGGGVYYQAGNKTFTLYGGAISGNTATGYGGGVYHGNGTFTMSGGTIGGEDNGNSAEKGGGLFVANDRTSTIQGNITYNHATTEGGGIAVGGAKTRLMFGGSANVQHNTFSGGAACNVYLNQDSNTIVQSTGLSDGAYVGVYVANNQQAKHDGSNMPFGTYAEKNSGNLNRFVNDRWNTLYGVQGDTTKKEIKWASFVCKITDADGNLLYKDSNGAAAVYDALEGDSGAFKALNVDSPKLYKKVGDTYRAYPKADAGETTTYQVQMLVPKYELKSQISFNQSTKTVTLTTASTTPDEMGFMYDDSKNPYAIVIRGGNKTYQGMFALQSGKLIFESIVLDGGSTLGYVAKDNAVGGILYLKSNESQAVIGANATLRNSTVVDKGGGAVRLENGSILTMNGGRIENCSAKWGGGVSIHDGIFTMNDGIITGCTATDSGGGVGADTIFNMNGGTITNNSAQKFGGGISLGKQTARVTFSGNPVVMGNTLSNGTPCNLELRRDSVKEVNDQLPYGLIKSAGLGAKAQIGIYTVDAFYSTFGQETQKFAIWETDSKNLFAFINDRNTVLRGYKTTGDHNVIWEKHQLLTVANTVESDLDSDANVQFKYTVTLTTVDEAYSSFKNKVDEITDNDGNAMFGVPFHDSVNNSVLHAVAEFYLKSGETATAIFPETLNGYAYEVTEVGVKVVNGEDIADYDTTAEKVGTHSNYYDASARTVTGTLGENMAADSPIACLAQVDFTNTRKTGTLVVSNKVVSETDDDLLTPITYSVTLSDTTGDKEYTATKTGVAEPISLAFTDGKTTFDLKHGESITIQGLPKGADYTVSERLSNPSVRTFGYQNVADIGDVDIDEKGVRLDPDADGNRSMNGTIGENTETVGSQEAVISRVYFRNTYLSIVCKITDRNRNLLYYKEANGTLRPAIYSRVEDAFDQISYASNQILTAGGIGYGTSPTNTMRVELIVPTYKLERAITLNGRTVILTTATADDAEYPYDKGESSSNTATIYRGECNTTMITDSGTLTLDSIILDGRANESVDLATAASVACDGGIVRVYDTTKQLTVNSGATLRNAKITGNGGAICMDSASTSLAMNGKIENCTAANGGGVYTVFGFSKFQIGGTITGCTATANGGAVYAAEKGGSTATAKYVTVLAGAAVTGNNAGGSGGAIWSGAPMQVRGTIGSNTAGSNGGGVYMSGSDAMFTMYATGVITGNHADGNGGGLAAAYTARVSGGSFIGNTTGDTGKGGAIYAYDGAQITIAVASTLQNNQARYGGAIYAGEVGANTDVNISGGTFTGNQAATSGSAVYIAAGNRLDMTGGTIGYADGGEGTPNKSDGGAVYAEKNAVLNFSGNVVIQNNTAKTGSEIRNVYLNFDSNKIIQTSGLGTKASIGVYAADGNDAITGKNVYTEHGVSARKFGIYIGNKVGGANLKKFTNDRVDGLEAATGPAWEEGVSGNYYVMWTGRGLELQVLRVKPGDAATAVSGARFELRTTPTDLKVWSGVSDTGGIVSIPWGPEDKENGTSVSFTNGEYILRQTAAGGDTVLPAGYWTLQVHEDNSVTWTAVSGAANEDQINEIPTSGVAYLGDLFTLNNDAQPRVIYHAGYSVSGSHVYGKWGEDEEERTRIVDFGTTDTNYAYSLDETIPAWSMNVFTGWATAADPGAGDYVYQPDETILFYRNSDAEPVRGESSGDLHLYAQWDKVVCKITDRDGTLLYINGSPAVYGYLEDAFDAINNSNNSTFTYKAGSRASARRIEMLVENYELGSEGLKLESGKTILLTTASRTGSDEYTYSGTNSRCTIYRGALTDAPMITVDSNLTVQNIILDGRANADADPAANVCDGGIIYVHKAAAVVSVGTRAELHNSLVDGDGGAIYAAPNTRVYLRGGTVSGNSVTDGHNGAGVYLNPTSKLYISDDPNFGGSGIESDALVYTRTGGGYAGNFVVQDTYTADTKNGGLSYPMDGGQYVARQDIYIAGHGSDNEDDTSANSLVIAGNITSGAGTIWVWAEESPRYKTLKQFAVVDRGVTVTEETCNAFRNARDDETTGNNTGEYLHGTLEGEVKGCVYWSGFSGSGTVILRKVNSANEPVYNATFTVYRGTSTDPYEVDGTALTGLTSGDQGNGVFYAGELPYGIYWIEETAVPSGYSTTRRYFKLAVTKDGNEISPASENRNG